MLQPEPWGSIDEQTCYILESSVSSWARPLISADKTEGRLAHALAEVPVAVISSLTPPIAEGQAKQDSSTEQISNEYGIALQQMCVLAIRIQRPFPLFEHQPSSMHCRSLFSTMSASFLLSEPYAERPVQTLKPVDLPHYSALAPTQALPNRTAPTSALHPLPQPSQARTPRFLSAQSQPPTHPYPPPSGAPSMALANRGGASRAAATCWAQRGRQLDRDRIAPMRAHR